jgi:CubicO group peptidase (beta-lactamase class C family)
VTIRRLLNHTSGIPDAYSGKLVDALMRRSARPTNADLLAVLSTADGLLFDPGYKFQYSNTGYDVLGALIERVSGQSYPDFLEENIFGPLGMKNSFSLPSPRQKTDPLLAHSYVKYQGVIQPFDTYWLDDIVGSGTAYSTVEDMFLYDQALYTDAIVRQSTLAEAFQPAALIDGTKSQYGFAWELTTEGGVRSFAHSGKWLGYQSYYERFPDLKLSIVVLMNWNYGPTVEDVESSIRKIYLD